MLVINALSFVVTVSVPCLDLPLPFVDLTFFYPNLTLPDLLLILLYTTLTFYDLTITFFFSWHFIYVLFTTLSWPFDNLGWPFLNLFFLVSTVPFWPFNDLSLTSLPYLVLHDLSVTLPWPSVTFSWPLAFLCSWSWQWAVAWPDASVIIMCSSCKLYNFLIFQLICEAYHLMKNTLGMSPPEMSKVCWIR